MGSLRKITIMATTVETSSADSEDKLQVRWIDQSTLAMCLGSFDILFRICYAVHTVRYVKIGH